MSDAELLLFYAVLHEDTALVSAALAEGATVDVEHRMMWDLATGMAFSFEEARSKKPDATDSAWRQEELQFILRSRETKTEFDRTWTPLFLAVALNLPEISEILLAAGASPNVTDEAGETPLSLACHHNASMMAEALLGAGASPTSANTDGITPLHRAVGHLNLSLVTQLLAAGADPNASSNRGTTPLLVTGTLLGDFLHLPKRKREHRDLATFPLEALGTSFFPFDKSESRTPILAALLRAGADPNVVQGETDEIFPARTPLLIALSLGFERTNIELLLNAGANPNFHPKNPPIITAAGKGDVELIQLLQAHGADIHARCETKTLPETVLSAAAESGSVALMHYLWDGGLRDDDACALRKAVAANKTETVAFLLDNGGDVNQRLSLERDSERMDGITPLMIAAGRAHVEMVRFLLERGADPTLRNSLGQTALDATNRQTRVERVREKVDTSAEGVLSQIDIPESLGNDFRNQLAQQLETMQSGFNAMMDKMHSKEQQNLAVVRALLEPLS